MRLGNRYSLLPVREIEKAYAFASDEEGWVHSWTNESTSGSTAKSHGFDGAEGNPAGSLQQHREAACHELGICSTTGRSTWTRTITAAELGLHAGTRIRRIGLESEYKSVFSNSQSSTHSIEAPRIKADIGSESRTHTKTGSTRSATRDWGSDNAFVTFALGSAHELDFTDVDARVGNNDLVFEFSAVLEADSGIGTGPRRVEMWWDNPTIIVETEDERVIRVRL